MDFAENYRTLPFVGVLKPECYAPEASSSEAPSAEAKTDEAASADAAGSVSKRRKLEE